MKFIDKDVLEYFTFLYNCSLSDSAINTTRSAVSTITPCIDGKTVGKHDLICRFMKGIFV
jgi:hypothetical protein